MNRSWFILCAPFIFFSIYLWITDQDENDGHGIAEISEKLESRRREQGCDEDRSLNLYPHALQYLVGKSSWTTIRGPILSWNFIQLPPEMWREVISFLANDGPSLAESFFVADLRSGFLFPDPHFSFGLCNFPLLSMIPLIEGHLRCDTWTMGRIDHVGANLSDIFAQ